MIQVQLFKTAPLIQNESSIILQHLNSRLDKEKFNGKIYLTYKAGQLEYVKIEQSFNIDSLVDTLNR